VKISKKCQYALKAVFELTWRNQGEPIRAQEIADAQHVSLRFMEIILNGLKHGGFIESRRGKEGGYMLAVDARDLTVRQIIEHIEGPISLAQNSDDAASVGNEVFKEFWQEVNNAVGEVCDNKSFADLVEIERIKRNKSALNYSI
jgi:Rrf2 family cysteine metabolism transcriptional repressor